MSTSLVPYNPDIPHVRSYMEMIDRSAPKQIEADRLTPVLPALNGQNSIAHSGLFFTPPAYLNTDLFIGVEIYRRETDEKGPILIFSHGMGADPIQYRPLLNEIASHGYVVLSVAHPSAIEDVDLPPAEEAARASSMAKVMANDIQYVLDQVRSGSLRGVGDGSRIFLGGHSLGGAASINVSRNDPAIAGCVNLDGFLQGNEKTEGLKQPLLMLLGDHKGWVEELKKDPDEGAREYANRCSNSLAEYETLYQNSVRVEQRSEKIVLPGSGHMDFTDAPFRKVLKGENSLDSAMKVHTFVFQTMLQFMKNAGSTSNNSSC